jgi:uncharacterized membrane protein
MKILFFIIACGAFFACNNHAANTADETDSFKQDGTELKDSLPIQPDTLQSTAAAAPPVQGFFGGVMNAAGGPLQHTIAFYPNYTYRLEESVNGKVVAKNKGKWAASGEFIQLEGDHIKRRYRLKDGDLVHVQSGQQTILKKLPSAMENKVWAAKQKEGITFFGVGNEPFWNVTVDEQKGIAFHWAEWKEPLRFAPAKAQITTDSIIYNTANDTAQLSVVIYSAFCSDGMSDYTYDQKVKVVYNGQVFNGCGIRYKGF